MDWNWFFSFFSQSAAALLGILGAFIISKLLGIEEKVNSLKSDLENQIITYKRVKRNLSVRRYKWVNDMYISYDDDLIGAIKNRQFDSMSEQEILDYLYNNDTKLYKDDESILQSFKELYEKHKPKQTCVEPRKTMFEIPEIRVTPMEFTLPTITPVGLWDRVGHEKELINNYIVEAKESIEKFVKLKVDSTNFNNSIKAIQRVIWVLIVAFPILVIYPLHFMPSEVGVSPLITFNIEEILGIILSLKNILLLVFFLAIEGIFIYFQVLTYTITKDLRSIIDKNLDIYKTLENYCSYYRQ